MDRLYRGATLGFFVSTAVIGLTACDPCGLVPCDGAGFGVWVTNESSDRVLVAFEPSAAETWVVPSDTIDGRGPWVSLAVDGAPGEIGRILLYDEDCDVIRTMEVTAGEYRLQIAGDGGISLSEEDVLNEAGDSLVPATTTC